MINIKSLLTTKIIEYKRTQLLTITQNETKKIYICQMKYLRKTNKGRRMGFIYIETFLYRIIGVTSEIVVRTFLSLFLKLRCLVCY